MNYNKLEDSDSPANVRHIQSKDINPGGSVSLENTPLVNIQNDDADKAARRKKHIKWGIIGGIILIVVVLAIVLPIVLIKKGGGGGDNGDQHGPLPPGRMNPYSSIGGMQSLSGSRASVSGYLIANNVQSNSIQEKAQEAIPKQFLNFLTSTTNHQQDTTKKVGVDWRNLNFFGPNNQLKGNLSYSIDMISPSTMRMVVTTGNETRYSIPEEMIGNGGFNPTTRLDMMGFQFFDGKKETFGFQLRDNQNFNDVLLSTINQTLIFSDKYIQMDFILPTQFIYGFGDRIHEFRLSEGAYTMWASGQDGTYDDGKTRGGLSGVHPFVLYQTKKGQYMGLFFRNSNAMTPVIRYNDDGTSTLSFITIGGQLEVMIFNQDTAHGVIQNYQNFVGLSKIPPFWALGWQEASPQMVNGINAQASVATAVTNYQTNGFPLDAVYLPADSWDSNKDFTLDNTKFPDVSKLVDILQKSNRKLVAYLDAAINVNDRNNNPAYQNGKNSGVFIKSTVHPENTDGYLINSKMGKKVVYVDWLNSKCLPFWSAQISNYGTEVEFDGLWTTMNEPFGDLDGELTTSSSPQLPQLQLSLTSLLTSILSQSPRLTDGGGEETPYDQSWFFSFWPLNDKSTFYLPFIPALNTSRNFDANTLSLNASHAGGMADYDVHSLYAHGMMRATQNALVNNPNRKFILTKGSFSGTGQFSNVQAHTNNERSWDSLYFGLQSVFRSQLFGMTMSGTDVCGYKAGDSTTLDEELCLRWYQLAAFFPLARHSQENKGPRTEPFNFKDAGKMNQVKRAMHDRMQYLRLLYTCMFQASDGGGTCIDPLQFVYDIPQKFWNTGSLPDFSNSFMFAGSLKVSPIMNKTSGATTFKSYFPKGTWVSMADWNQTVQGQDDMYMLDATMNYTQVHLAPASVIPFQNNSDMMVNTTADLLKKPISLVINRDQNGQANGQLFLDTGLLISEMDDQTYEYYNFQVQANSIQVEPWVNNKGLQNHTLDTIFLVNADDLQNVNYACYYRPDSLDPVQLQTEFLTDKRTLSLTPVSSTPLKFSELLNVYYGNSNSSQVNLCNKKSFQYVLPSDQTPDLNGRYTTFTLQHALNKLDNITMYIGFYDQGVLNINWTWANQSNHQRMQYGMPSAIVDSTPRDLGKSTDTLSMYVEIVPQPFKIIVKSRVKGPVPETLLTLEGLIFDEYMNWINVTANAMPTDTEDKFRGIFGLGERASKNLFFNTGVYSMWTKDIGNPLEDGKLPGKQTYGVHPFYMYKHNSVSWVGVFHNSAQAQDWWIKNDYQTGQVSISSVAAGGRGDIFVFLSAQNPRDIVAKYHTLVGNPVLIPQWALGWNQCKWCYWTLADVKASSQGYIDNKIPLDTQWVDIDYMEEYKDFTYAGTDMSGNPGDFAGLPDFVNTLHQRNMKFVPIIDAGISYRPGQDYGAFNRGMEQDVFLKANGSVFVGKVWPNEASYPDFTHPNATGWWSSELQSFRKQVPFDGLWQDMNEASNFCWGGCSGAQFDEFPVAQRLPYTPTGERLETKAISLDAKHYNGMTQLDAHSLFGTLQVAASDAFFKSNSMRTMIISRSSAAGMGKYGSTWLGDNSATVTDLEESVISIMDMNMFGIPLTGADICGFGGPDNRNNTLCTRWHAVGTFYPFSRNHKECGGDPQEPWRFTDIYQGNTTYRDLMKVFIQRKYHLMRYIYTQMIMVSMGNSSTYYKPMFFEFPEDPNAFDDIANNVMLGPAIKTSVNARDLNSPTTDFYFPQGTWCSLFEPVGDCITNKDAGQNQTLGSRLHEQFAHLREGYIIPMQNATALQAMTTVDLQNAPVDFHILGASKFSATSWTASGDYLNDDGLNRTLTDNVNQYFIQAQYSRTVGEQVTITFGQLKSANNFFGKMEANCTAVNKADYLQSIYVYNANNFRVHDKFYVQVAYKDNIEDYVTIGMAQYDAGTNRIIYDGSALGNTVCLSRVFRIVFRNYA